MLTVYNAVKTLETNLKCIRYLLNFKPVKLFTALNNLS